MALLLLGGAGSPSRPGLKGAPHTGTQAASEKQPHLHTSVLFLAVATACSIAHAATPLPQAELPVDLLESIIFPNATIAQDYEAHIVETADGQSSTGMIKSETADALVLLDLGGQEKSIPSAQILGRQMMSTSLMPSGLEQAFTDQQLLDLVAWLGSLK
jgi:putative heme-binding domain-containing protein